MATAVQVESLWSGLTDNNGQPLAAGKVFTYAAGTTTPVSLFTAADKSTSATNPLILDAYGKAQVWADGRYKFVVKTSADVTLYTLDNLLYGFDDTTVLYGGTSTGSANAQVVSVPATVTSYANGQTISFVAGYTNTGATTLQFNSLSAVSLVKGATPSSLQAGDLIAGQLYTATYHGGAFRLTDYPTVADVQRSRFETATGVAGTNTITANLTPALTGYETGMVVQFVAASANTGATTLNLNGLGAKAVQRQGAALVGGEFKTGDVVSLFYDGTQFQIVNIPSAPLFVDRTNNRVGIGTASPNENLTVLGGTGVAATISLRGNNSAAGSEMVLSQASDGSTVYIWNRANGMLLLGTNNLERVRVDANGNVGIGRIAGVLVDAQRDANDTLTRYRVHNPNSGSAAEVAINLGNNLSDNAAGMVLNSSANTARAGASSLTIFNGLSAPIRVQAGSAGGVDLASGGTSWAAVSDLRRKKNITPLSYGLSEILELEPIRFDYTDDESDQSKRIGFIAQDVKVVIPEAVNGSDETYYTLSATELIPALVNAVHELADKVATLENKVQVLEGA